MVTLSGNVGKFVTLNRLIKMISLIKYASIGIIFYVIFAGMFTVNHNNTGEVALIFNGMRDGYWTELAKKASNDFDTIISAKD